ncbi:DUF4124 domain-containing protein [Ideonella azotifigens]|uniref:DUF4124 domain-containing protein n=2 Tax=Ideonella azotifigens TaxID=513160 RepID=UPI001E498EA4|nr:DUF4124 domain-containing protein [Ideonella azotifigens]MCD2343838.1 DUF4124 domain-containing protein [Ideonella azotifigens]
MHHLRAALAALTSTALLLAAAGAVAATVYRWVDENGQVHYGEVVPEQYRRTAKPVEMWASPPSAEQQREAQERAQKEKARAAALAAEQDRRQPAAGAAPAASQPAGKRPAQVPNDQTDCDTWQRLYAESIECFGPYRTARGATKPEGFEVCNVVPEPPPTRCRLRIP